MKKICMTLCALAVLIQTTFAKEKPSLIFEVGTVGYEKWYVDSQKIYADGEAISLAVPYTRTVFNPDICIGISVPIYDLSEKVTFGIKGSYDFSLDSYEQDTVTSNMETTMYTHLFSLLPTFSLKKDKATFFIGTGLRFGLNVYDSVQDYEISSHETEYTLYQFFWVAEVGAKYQITEHLSVIGDMGIFVAFYSNTTIERIYTNSRYKDEYEETSIYKGEYPMYFSPKIGICYTF
mgnify:CR=1 FL=1